MTVSRSALTEDRPGPAGERRQPADFYPVLGKALAGLESAPPAARERIYANARLALFRQLAQLDPPLDYEATKHERLALEEAIRRIEVLSVEERLFLLSPPEAEPMEPSRAVIETAPAPPPTAPSPPVAPAAEQIAQPERAAQPSAVEPVPLPPPEQSRFAAVVARRAKPKRTIQLTPVRLVGGAAGLVAAVLVVGFVGSRIGSSSATTPASATSWFRSAPAKTAAATPPLPKAQESLLPRTEPAAPPRATYATASSEPSVPGRLAPPVLAPSVPRYAPEPPGAHAAPEQQVLLSPSIALRGPGERPIALEPPASRSAEENNRRGEYAIRRGELDRAIRDFTAALNVDPSFTNALINRGTAWAKKGDLARAAADFNAAVRLDKTNTFLLESANKEISGTPASFLATAYLRRARICSARGLQARAVGDLTTAIELDPDRPAPYLERARLNESLGRVDAAIDDFRRTLSFNPGNKEAAEALGRLGVMCPLCVDSSKATGSRAARPLIAE